MENKKSQVLKALTDYVDPPPQDLIDELNQATDLVAINRKVNMWMGYTKEDWKSLRGDLGLSDGFAIYNALQRTQGLLISDFDD